MCTCGDFAAMVAASSDLEAQLSASESDRARLQREGTELKREAVRLKEQLVDRDEQFSQLAQQFNVLRRKYEHLKGTYNEVMWGYLPANSPEFRSLDVSYPGGCSVVAFESDSHVDSIELFSVLGTGSFGDVHLGSHNGPNGETEVALKTIAKVRIRSLASLRNLANEVACMRHLTQVLAALQRPEAAGLEHIVTLIHASISDTNVYLAQSNGGSDLFTLIGLSSRSGADKARLPVEIVAAVARGLMAAIAAVHRNGWCHRDIKPENVLLSGGSEEPQVKLVDFGLARGFDTERQMRTVCGTHRYLAPEMISCERNERQGYDKAIDMWGVGLLVHIMLFGSNPFQRETEAKTHAAIMSGELDFPESNVTEGAKAFIRRLLCRSPDERMTSREALESEWLHEPEVQSAVDEEHSKERTQPLVVRAEGDKGGDTAVKRRLWEWNAERLMARAVKFTHRRLGAAAKEKLAVANAHAESSSRESPPIASSDTMLPNVLPSARSARAVAVVSTPLASMNAPASAPSDPTKMFARRRNTTGLLGFQSPIGLTRANRRSHDT